MTGLDNNLLLKVTVDLPDSNITQNLHINREGIRSDSFGHLSIEHWRISYNMANCD